MPATSRAYDRAPDYERVGRFLVRTYCPSGTHVNWLQPRWEYMHFHPYVKRIDLPSIGLWEADRGIVGVVHPEHSMGWAYFEIDPAHGSLRKDMLEYAEEHLAVERRGGRELTVYINDRDRGFHSAAEARGYVRTETCEPMSALTIPDPFPEIALPEGFKMKSLADDNDLRKLNRVLWRGFGHGEEPPDEGIEDRRFMQSAPNYRHDLNLVVEAPEGDFAAYGGIWFEPTHRIAYVEPVATDPEYRRMGLARAVVLESLRRCGRLGATIACVGSNMPFYRSLGFRRVYNRSAWRREWR